MSRERINALELAEEHARILREQLANLRNLKAKFFEAMARRDEANADIDEIQKKSIGMERLILIADDNLANARDAAKAAEIANAKDDSG